MKTFAIGDIHGCYEEFEKLLGDIGIDFSTDKLIMLGDYIDRGDKSYEVIKKVQSLKEKYGKDKVIVLKGNHEQMAIDYFESGRTSYLHNGGGVTIESFQRNGDNLEEYVDCFKELANYYEDENYIYVHGGVKPGVNLNKQKEEDLLWIREEFFLNSHANDKPVIFGHTPTYYINGDYFPVNINRNIAIDTACYFGGRLSALEIEEGKVIEIHQVKNSKKSQNDICA